MSIPSKPETFTKVPDALDKLWDWLASFLVQTQLLFQAADLAKGVTYTTLAAIPNLTATLTNGSKYVFRIVLRLDDDHAEGIKIDLNGGTATVTNFWASFLGIDNAVTVITHTTTLAGLMSCDGFAGVGLLTIEGSIEPSSDGTFIPRFAQKTHSAGILTVKRGSYMEVKEIT